MKRLFFLSVLFLTSIACALGRATITPDFSTPTAQNTFPPTETPEDESDYSVPVPVPNEYRELYDSLEEILERFHLSIDASWEGGIGDVTFGAELAPANGNRGEGLLQAGSLYGVRLYLDRLEQLGMGGATVAISYPLLAPNFPRSEEYLQFYQNVADEVRQRGLKLLVKTGPVFPDSEFSNVQLDISHLSMADYFQERKEQILLIARDIRPDYLSFGAEPETEAMLTGFQITPDIYVAFIEDILSEIDRSSGVLLGAGTGTWENPAFLERISQDTALDFVDLHIYPIQGAVAYLQRVRDAASSIRAQSKIFIIGEAWLYKASPQEVMQSIAYQEVFTRDVYSFWAPLDTRFIEAVMKIANKEDFEYVSFFWSKYFFAYLDYEETSRDLPPTELVLLSNQAAVENLQAGLLSETGKSFKTLLSQAPFALEK